LVITPILCRYTTDNIAVYNHVLKLNLSARQWSLVDNFGDIPGVRMGEYGVMVRLTRC